MSRPTKVVLLEALLGPLVPTVLFLPFVMAGLAGSVIALGAVVFDFSRPLDERLIALAPIAFFGGLELSAVVGSVALWISVLVDEDAVKKGRRRTWLMAGLLVGLLAAASWLGTMALAEPGYDPSTWILWLILLGGPIIVGLRRLRALFLARPPDPA